MIYRFTKGKLPKRNFLLPVAEANPKRGREWEAYEKTWKRCDKDPDTLPEDYPLWRYHYNKHYNPKRATQYVERKIKTYKNIKANGFTYDSVIIRAYEAPWNYIDDGHTRISILRHLEPDAVIEVAGYGRPPPRP